MAGPADPRGRGGVGAPVGRRRSRRCAGRRSRSCPAPSSTPGPRWRRRRRGPIPGRTAREVLDVLQARGAVFVQEIARVDAPPAGVGRGGAGGAGGRGARHLRLLRRAALAAGARLAAAVGRACPAGAGAWSDDRRSRRRAAPAAASPHAEFVARVLLRRTGVVFRRTVTRERIPVPWRDVARACRTLEARGEIRGGRFVGRLRRRAVRAAGSGHAAARGAAAGRPAAGLDAAQRGRVRPAQLPGDPHPGRAGARVRRLRGRGRLIRPAYSFGQRAPS